MKKNKVMCLMMLAASYSVGFSASDSQNYDPYSPVATRGVGGAKAPGGRSVFFAPPAPAPAPVDAILRRLEEEGREGGEGGDLIQAEIRGVLSKYDSGDLVVEVIFHLLACVDVSRNEQFFPVYSFFDRAVLKSLEGFNLTKADEEEVLKNVLSYLAKDRGVVRGILKDVDFSSFDEGAIFEKIKGVINDAGVEVLKATKEEEEKAQRDAAQENNTRSYHFPFFRGTYNQGGESSLRKDGKGSDGEEGDQSVPRSEKRSLTQDFLQKSLGRVQRGNNAQGERTSGGRSLQGGGANTPDGGLVEGTGGSDESVNQKGERSLTQEFLQKSLKTVQERKSDSQKAPNPKSEKRSLTREFLQKSLERVQRGNDAQQGGGSGTSAAQPSSSKGGTDSDEE